MAGKRRLRGSIKYVWDNPTLRWSWRLSQGVEASTSADVPSPVIPDSPPPTEVLYVSPALTRDPDRCSDNEVDLTPFHEGGPQSVLAVPSAARAAEIHGHESTGKTNMEEKEDNLDKE